RAAHLCCIRGAQRHDVCASNAPTVIRELEHDLQTKLNVSRIVARAEYLSEWVIRTAVQAVADVCASKIVTKKLAAVLRVIEGVQEFSSKLCLESFSNI